ncbi:MAG: hypothetical protein M5U09_18535 [Gammaproteobacteria bacterium]|nr:hypothetical protein [Gammaproteobacteria bacterium]
MPVLVTGPGRETPMRSLLRLAAVLLPLVSASAFNLPREAAPEQLARIEAALPAAAPAKPLKPRRLLIFDVNVDYGGHGSIPTANTAFTPHGPQRPARSRRCSAATPRCSRKSRWRPSMLCS